MLFSPRGQILCTEDDPDTRELLTFVLSEVGYEVTCTEDADEAIFLALNKPFDLILVDNWLPRSSGVDLTRSLREMDVKTPILFYSGAAYESDKQQARAVGAQGYLVKPVLHEDLIREVARLIAESETVLYAH